MQRGVRRIFLQKFFVWVKFAVFARVVERNIGVGTLIAVIDFAHVEGLRVYVDTDGALIEFGKIQHLMNGRKRVDICGVCCVHFVVVGGSQVTGAVG